MKNKARPLSKNPLSIASKNVEGSGIKLLNPRREALSPALLKSFPSYQHLSDAEAEEKCSSIRMFARVLMEYIACDKKTTLIDNQDVISLASSDEDGIVRIGNNTKKQKAA